MADKKLIGRGGMQIRPGVEAPLGYFPNNLDTSHGGWSSQALQIYSSALSIGKRHHDRNVALNLAQQTNRQPELPDIQARNQAARLDAKRLEALKNQKAAIASQVKQKESELTPFDYSDGGTIGFLKRQEMRAQLKTMSNEERQNKMRTYQWRRAALESEPELSGLSESMYRALESETVQAFYPEAVAGIKEGKQALEAIDLALRTVEKAVDYELKSTAVTDHGPPPEESEPWVD